MQERGSFCSGLWPHRGAFVSLYRPPAYPRTRTGEPIPAAIVRRPGCRSWPSIPRGEPGTPPQCCIALPVSFYAPPPVARCAPGSSVRVVVSSRPRIVVPPRGTGCRALAWVCSGARLAGRGNPAARAAAAAQARGTAGERGNGGEGMRLGASAAHPGRRSWPRARRTPRQAPAAWRPPGGPPGTIPAPWPPCRASWGSGFASHRHKNGGRCNTGPLTKEVPGAPLAPVCPRQAPPRGGHRWYLLTVTG